MGIWISYAEFDISTLEVVTYWSRDYASISFMWIFELTNDFCITYCDIYLPRSCLFTLFRHLIWLWISELPKKHLIYYCGHLTWKTYITDPVRSSGGTRGGGICPKIFSFQIWQFQHRNGKIFLLHTFFVPPPKKNLALPPPQWWWCCHWSEIQCFQISK